MTLDRCSYCLFILSLVLGVLFYDFIANVTGFTFVDEIIALLLLALYALKIFKTKVCSFEFLCVMCVFLCYLFYSIYIHTNVKAAIYMDFLILIKPFIAFYCFYEIMPEFTEKRKKNLRNIAKFCGLFCLIIGVGNFIHPFFAKILYGPRLATASTISAFTYLVFSDYKKKDIKNFVILLAIGLLSFKSKHYVFFAGVLGFAFLVKDMRPRKLFLYSLFILPLMAYVGFEKFDFYFIQGAASESIFARPALYMGAWDILNKYVPFGPGFGSYGSYAANVYMSPLYMNVPVLKFSHEIQDGLFLCDAFIPSLAEFGYAGFALFLFFWYKQVKKGFVNYLINQNRIILKMILLIALFFFIESVPDTTFTHNRGMVMMMFLAVCLKTSFSEAQRKLAAS